MNIYDIYYDTSQTMNVATGGRFQAKKSLHYAQDALNMITRSITMKQEVTEAHPMKSRDFLAPKLWCSARWNYNIAYEQILLVAILQLCVYIKANIIHLRQSQQSAFQLILTYDLLYSSWDYHLIPVTHLCAHLDTSWSFVEDIYHKRAVCSHDMERILSQ